MPDQAAHTTVHIATHKTTQAAAPKIRYHFAVLITASVELA
jgi:hypothetical protein